MINDTILAVQKEMGEKYEKYSLCEEVLELSKYMDKYVVEQIRKSQLPPLNG